MLTALRVKNFTIVAELELQFTAGMTAFTGETGAGKSIMIDALMLALGARADVGVLRPGAESCDIQACFTCTAQSQAQLWLAEHDLAEGDDIFIRRVITREGRSKAYINGVAFPLQKVKELSVNLVHIHGQHEHQTLFSTATHREHLDRFAQHGDLRKQLAAAYHRCQALKAEQARLRSNSQVDNQDLAADFNEWQTVMPLEGEIEALHQEHQLLHHAETYASQMQTILQTLQAEDGGCIHQTLHLSLQQLARLPQDNSHIHSAQNLLEQARILCDEAYDELNRFGDAITLDPQRLQTVEKRMGILHLLARKWHITVNELPAQGQIFEQAFIADQERDKRITQLAADYEAAKQSYHLLAEQIRASRLTSATHLAKQITEYIQELGMPHGCIEVVVTPATAMQEHGQDIVEYRVATNPGMPPDLLTKIASGGELSRISLAIQLIAAQQGNAATLFFDEVDVGIGGGTAAIVGRLLRQLGNRLQVFCVTHQPQVAASAHHHFLVQKTCEQDQTFSQMTPLKTHADKVEELARMLGGLTISAQTRLHAQELLESLTA